MFPKNIFTEEDYKFFNMSFPEIPEEQVKKYSIELPQSPDIILTHFKKGFAKLQEIFKIEKNLNCLFQIQGNAEEAQETDFERLKQATAKLSPEGIAWKHVLHLDELSQRLPSLQKEDLFMVLTAKVLKKMYNFCVESMWTELEMEKFRYSSISEEERFSIAIQNLDVMHLHNSISRRMPKKADAKMDAQKQENTLAKLQRKVMKNIRDKHHIRELVFDEISFVKHMFGKETDLLVRLCRVINPVLVDKDSQALDKFKKNIVALTSDKFYKEFSRVREIAMIIISRYNKYSLPGNNFLIENLVRANKLSSTFESLKNIPVNNLMEVYEFMQVVSVLTQLEESLGSGRSGTNAKKSSIEKIKATLNEKDKNFKQQLLKILSLFVSRFLIPEQRTSDKEDTQKNSRDKIGEVVPKWFDRLSIIENATNSNAKRLSETERETSKLVKEFISGMECEMKCIRPIIKHLIKK